MGDDAAQRLCPHCGRQGSETICPVDEMPTIDVERFKSSSGPGRLIGQVFDERYEIKAALGRGSTGWVFRAWDQEEERDVAIKVLRSDLGGDLRQVQRFYREAKTIAELVGPHTVRQEGFGVSEDGHLFIAMELLEGQGLDELIRAEGTLAPERIAELARQVCLALGEAHARGLVHRDLKPENIFVCVSEDGSERVKILDFGLAKLVNRDAASESNPSLTKVGWIVGTPRYMAPEQASGGAVGPATDLYSLGVVLFEALAGRPPFVGDDSEAVLLMHVKQPAPPLPAMAGRRVIPTALAQLVQWLMAKAPEQRPPDARTVRQVLEGVIEGRQTDAFDLPPTGEPTSTDTGPQLGTLDPGEWWESASQVQTGHRGLSEDLSLLLARKRRRRGWMAAAAAALLVTGGLVWGFGGGSDQAGVPEVEQVASANPAAQTPSSDSGVVAAGDDTEVVGRSPDADLAASIPLSDPLAEAALPSSPAESESESEAAESESESEPAAETEPEAPMEVRAKTVVVAPAPAEDVAPQATWVNIVTEPAGARVYEGGRKLGVTPMTVMVTGERKLRLKRTGYAVEALELNAKSPGTLELRLDKLQPRSRSNKAKKERRHKKKYEIRLL